MIDINDSDVIKEDHHDIDEKQNLFLMIWSYVKSDRDPAKDT